MDASCGSDSLLPNRCTVRGSVARVTGLKQNTVYRFRVNAIYEDIKTDFSQPSDPLQTAGDAGTSDCLSSTVQTNLSLSALFVRMFTVLQRSILSLNPATYNYDTTFIYKLKKHGRTTTRQIVTRVQDHCLKSKILASTPRPSPYVAFLPC